MKSIAKSMLFLLLFGALSIAYSQTAAELIAQADNYSTKEFNNQKAIMKLFDADKISKNNWEIMWRISRSSVDIGEHMKASSDEQLKKYEEAKYYADEAVRLAPNKSVCYLRRAIVNGRIALFKGVFKAIGLVGDVKSDIEKAISLNNGSNEIMAACHYVLGRSHAKVCEKPYLVRLPLGLGWGDIDISIKEFKKAIEMRPEFKMYHLDFAKTLISEKEWQSAKEQLLKVPALPKLDEDDDTFVAESKTLLEQIKNK